MSLGYGPPAYSPVGGWVAGPAGWILPRDFSSLFYVAHNTGVGTVGVGAAYHAPTWAPGNVQNQAAGTFTLAPDAWGSGDLYVWGAAQQSRWSMSGYARFLDMDIVEPEVARLKQNGVLYLPAQTVEVWERNPNPGGGPPPDPDPRLLPCPPQPPWPYARHLGGVQDIVGVMRYDRRG